MRKVAMKYLYMTRISYESDGSICFSQMANMEFAGDKVKRWRVLCYNDPHMYTLVEWYSRVFFWKNCAAICNRVTL